MNTLSHYQNFCPQAKILPLRTEQLDKCLLTKAELFTSFIYFIHSNTRKLVAYSKTSEASTALQIN